MSSLTDTSIARRQEVYICRCLYSQNSCVFEFSRRFNKLVAWGWPASLEARFPPDDSMREYRSKHQMLGPCCLCPLIYPDGPDFVEAAMYFATTGSHAGMYVASCAKDKCGYLVPLERLYTLPGLYIKSYPRRALGERVPSIVTHISEVSVSQTTVAETQRRPLKRSFAMLDVTADDVQPQRPLKRLATDRQSRASQLLARLDSATGITRREFRKLFAKCDLCSGIVTRRAFPEHECNVIDLTSD